MSVLRGFGYFIGIIIIIAGVISFPIGLVLIIPGIIMIWLLKKGGQVSALRKDMKEIRFLEEERMRADNVRRLAKLAADKEKLK